MPDDHNRDDSDDRDTDDDSIDVDVDPPIPNTVTLQIGEGDDDAAHLITWAELFTDADSYSEAVWEGLRRWIWIQSDYEGAVDAEDVPPTERGVERFDHATAAKERVNSTRLRSMSDAAVAAEIRVYQEYVNRKANIERVSEYLQASDHLRQARRALERRHDDVVTGAVDPDGNGDDSDIPDTK